MEYRLLGNTGLQVSRLGFGAASLGGVYDPIKFDDAIETVHVALAGGINFLDVAPAYGETLAETNLGIALRGVARDRYFLSTKIGSYSEARGDYDYSASRTRRSVEASLRRLGIDYIDLLICHDIEFADFDVLLRETLPTTVELKREGLIRHIGVSGLPLKIFPSILGRAEPGLIEAVLSFSHYVLNDTTFESLLPDLKRRGLGIINASPTAGGMLTQQGPPAWHPASPAIKAACRRAADHCRQRGADLAELAVQFACSHPDIDTLLVGTAVPELMRRNIACLARPIDPVLLAEVREILAPIRNCNYTRGRPEHRDPLVVPEPQ